VRKRLSWETWNSGEEGMAKKADAGRVRAKGKTVCGRKDV